MVDKKNQPIKAAEIKLSYNRKLKGIERPRIRSSKEAEVVLRTFFNPDTIELREEFYVLLLNQANRVLGGYRVSEGGISGTVADNKLIFASALLSGASSLIVSHNHPSGNTSPSYADEELTKKVKEGCKFLDLSLLDHLILTSNSFFSFADEGKL